MNQLNNSSTQDKLLNLNNIKLLLVEMASFYRTDITRQQVDMYADVLKNIPSDRVLVAIKKIYRNPEVIFFPLPCTIIKFLPPLGDLLTADQEKTFREENLKKKMEIINGRG